MTEHEIRLRRAWEGPCSPNEERSAARIDLPTAWIEKPAGPFALHRNFNLPRDASGQERIVLRLEAVPGLGSLKLNGRFVEIPDPLPAVLEIELHDRGSARNRLSLCVDPAMWPLPLATDLAWGKIAVVIQAV
jgi:hypothetical protein